VGNNLVVYKKHKIDPKNRKTIRTICEVLREIYHSADKRGDTFTMNKVGECYDMAKRMQYKLFEYQKNKSCLISIKNADGTYTIKEI